MRTEVKFDCCYFVWNTLFIEVSLTAYNTVISPNLLVWKFCGNQVKLRHFLQCLFKHKQTFIHKGFTEQLIWKMSQNSLERIFDGVCSPTAEYLGVATFDWNCAHFCSVKWAKTVLSQKTVFRVILQNGFLEKFGKFFGKHPWMSSVQTK